MRPNKTLRPLFGILFLTGGLFLAACGDNTATPAPSPTLSTTAVSTTAATATSAAAGAATTSSSTASSTTGAPTLAATTSTSTSTTAASTPAATPPPGTAVPTTLASAQTGSGKASDLLANIPDSPGYLSNLSFNNYVAFRKLANIPADATFQSLSQDKAAFTRFNNTIRYMAPAEVLKYEFFQTLRDTAGFDLLQADYDAQAGLPPNQISLAQGNFDAAAIDKAWTADGAVKAAVDSNTSYTFNKLDVTQNLQQIYLGPLSLVVAPARKLLILGKPPAAATAVAGELPSKHPLTGNAAVKAMLDIFGDPLSVYMGTSLISANVPDITNITPNATGAANVKATFQATQPVPPPLMGGYAFYQDDAGTKTYLVANYYADPASAKTAQPILENRLKTGLSNSNRQPYSNYFDVVSSEVKGNILVFKLNWKQLKGLNQFVFSRDFPAFLT